LKIITFDSLGISGHPNHIAVHNGVKSYLQNTEVQGFQLVTTSLIRKYIGILDILVSPAFDGEKIVLLTPHISLAYLAMKAHYSQFVWFRRLFIMFSRYPYINTLEQIQ
jgi:N-acetylglucosaminylphosphatidylinositol deacetylase